MTAGLVCGVDEAGRGPLAGPVVAAAVILDPNRPVIGLADSKALTEKRRKALGAEIFRTCHVAVGISEPEEIDRLNVLHATMAAMARAVRSLPVAPEHALIDGNRIPGALPCSAEALVRGDALEPCISAASIVAKTMRDALMTAADARYPGYGFASHKGYPAPVHREALMRLGPCPIHRRSFAPVRAAA